MKKFIFSLVLLGSFGAYAAEPTVNQQPTNQRNDDKKQNAKDLGFKETFPKPFYKTSYFGPVLTGVTIIGAGAFTYFTAGAGAPVAATGVSAIASWTAGGGAGSYMAGLSAIGGWFGGNAVLGSAILNGISIGVTGGGASFAALPAVGKAGVLASVSASALDGVAVFQNPETKNLTYRVRLTIPSKMGSEEVRALTKELLKVEKSLMDPDVRNDQNVYQAALKQRETILNNAIRRAQAAAKKGASNPDLIVLAVLAKTAGKSDLFRQLVYKVTVGKKQDSGYIDYLKAVDSVEHGDSISTKNLLRKSWRLNPYAIEQPLLLISVLSREGFLAHEEEIRGVAEQARNDFNSNKYEPGYSVVSVDFRMGTLYLNAKDYVKSYEYYEKAYKELALIQKLVGDQSMKKTIRVGMANALLGQGKKDEAGALFDKVLSDCKTDAERSQYTSQYAGAA
jgi:tetratricopeptide (TPR) repeat protein